jgi:hypothetical protein
MSNFFAQPDALATGQTMEAVAAQGVAQDLQPHQVTIATVGGEGAKRQAAS